jgi:transposase InsO family protein
VLRPPVESTQYLSIRYTERLADAGAVCSVGSRGDSYDNARADAVNGLHKAELIRKDGLARSLERERRINATKIGQRARDVYRDELQIVRTVRAHLGEDRRQEVLKQWTPVTK